MRGLVLSAEWKPKPDYEVTPAEERTHRARHGNMVWFNPTMAVAERPDPQISGDYDVLIRNRVCGICGSDVHMFVPGGDGYIGQPAQCRAPIAIGHEYSGEVLQVGRAVTRIKPGDLVAVEGQVNCGGCRPCLRGIPSSCDFIEDRGFTLDGGTATLSTAHERNCWPLTDVAERFGEAFALDVGALAEPGAVVYNGMVSRAGGFRPGDSVAVFGCGPIGLAAVGLARAMGAGDVFALEPSSAKREIASALGATATFDPTLGNAAVWLMEATKGVGVDMVVDASGAASRVMPAIFSSIAVGAKVVCLGVNQEPFAMDTLPLMLRSASMHGAVAHLGGGYPAIIALHAAGKLDLTQMITGRFDLENSIAAIERAVTGQDAKLMIHPQGLPA
ncbi:scyllo-inosose 3-dehydrogenase [Streptomyces mirabilis]|uniref:scyllo-inosose 3-dehydrogenase n=1 Tax=Streptomyces mirabilis TaxID=68239 RepID=UPI0033CC5CCF